MTNNEMRVNNCVIKALKLNAIRYQTSVTPLSGADHLLSGWGEGSMSYLCDSLVGSWSLAVWA